LFSLIKTPNITLLASPSPAPGCGAKLVEISTLLSFEGEGEMKKGCLSGGKPQHIAAEPWLSGMLGKNGELLFLLAQDSVFTMAGIDRHIIRQGEELPGDGFKDLLKGGRCRCLARASREERITGEEVFSGNQAQAAQRMARGMQYPQAHGTYVHNVTILKGNVWR
jgi:hypothetical protein